MAYGERLRMLRKRTRLTIGEAADVIDISESALALYERNEKKLPISVFIKLSCLYGFDVFDIMHVYAPKELDEDIPAYNLMAAHCRYITACRIESDMKFGNSDASEEYYNESYRELIREYASNPEYRERFPGLCETALPDKYFS